MHMGMLDLIVRVALVMATVFLFGIVFLTYLRVKSPKLLLISMGFGIFVVHALTYILELTAEEYRLIFTETNMIVIHLIALFFITMGILKE